MFVLCWDHHRYLQLPQRIRGTLAIYVGVISTLIATVQATAQYGRTDPYDGAVATLKRCSAFGQSGEHHALIVSLRSLDDQALRPFFQSLTQSSNWSSRVDGILGLAELSKNRNIDRDLILRLAATEDRSTAIRNAIGFRLIQPSTIQELLEIKDLPVLDQVVLNAELHRLGKKFADAAVRQGTADSSDEIASLASALILENGDPTAWKQFVIRLATLPPEVRNPVLQELGKACQLYEIRAPINSMIEIMQDESYTEQTRMIVIGAALTLNPSLGMSEWKKHTLRERGQASLVRSGLQLMSQEKNVEAGMGSALRNGEPLVEAIADAIEANASGDPKALASALEVVIDRANRTSAEWAVKRAASLPPELATQVWRHLLVYFLAAPRNAQALSTVVLDCASRLARVDPSAIENLIKASDREPQLQEILILALCNAANSQAADVAERVRGLLTRRGDALALLAMARGKSTLPPDVLANLGIVAAGGGDIDPTLLVQAAWLFVRHSGKAEQALAQIQSK